MITSRRRFLGWLGLGAAAAPSLPNAAQKIAEALAREPEPPIIRYASWSGEFTPGAITAVNITSAGTGYSVSPVVTITDSRLVTSGAKLAAITRRALDGGVDA